MSPTVWACHGLAALVIVVALVVRRIWLPRAAASLLIAQLDELMLDLAVDEALGRASDQTPRLRVVIRQIRQNPRQTVPALGPTWLVPCAELVVDVTDPALRSTATWSVEPAEPADAGYAPRGAAEAPAATGTARQGAPTSRAAASLAAASLAAVPLMGAAVSMAAAAGSRATTRHPVATTAGLPSASPLADPGRSTGGGYGAGQAVTTSARQTAAGLVAQQPAAQQPAAQQPAAVQPAAVQPADPDYTVAQNGDLLADHWTRLRDICREYARYGLPLKERRRIGAVLADPWASTS
jgi:hypothetical protein